MNAVDAWQNSLERGKEVCAVFLDLAKAFDKFPLLEKLRELDLTVFALRWLANYLLDRRQFVVGGESSSSAKVLSGVP